MLTNDLLQLRSALKGEYTLKLNNKMFNDVGYQLSGMVQDMNGNHINFLDKDNPPDVDKMTTLDVIFEKM
jgi:hypothetical protein